MPRINPYTRLKEEFDHYKRQVRIGAVLVLAALLLLWVGLHRNQQAAEAAQTVLQQEVAYWKDQNARAHATVATLEVSKKEMKQVADSLARVLRIKPKQIQSYAGAKIRVDTVVQPLYTEYVRLDTVYLPDHSFRVDTARTYHLHYRDSSFLSIEGEVPAKSGLRVTLAARLQVTEYWKRQWFLGKKTHYTDITTDNPYIQLSAATALKRQASATLKIRPGIGLGLNYNPLTRQVTPGVQVGVYLFKSR